MKLTDEESRRLIKTVIEYIYAKKDAPIGPVIEIETAERREIWVKIMGENGYFGATLPAAMLTATLSDWWIPSRDGRMLDDDFDWFERRAELGQDWEKPELRMFKEERRHRLALNIGLATNGTLNRNKGIDVELTVHRGTHEVGGSCVEIRSGESRIILDVGMPLFASNRDPLDTFALGRMSTEELRGEGILPNIEGVFTDGSAPNAILLSHAHLDHTGLLKHTPTSVPVYASSGTSKMMLAGALFARQVELPRDRFQSITPGQPLTIGDFTVTGFSVDHSIYGCLALMIEADGQRLLYSGDLRSHGRKPGMERQLVEVCQGKRIDVLMMEGTHFGFPDGNSQTEYELEGEIERLVRECSSLVLASFSPQHIDRLVAFIRTTQRTNRTFVADVYTAFLMHLLKNEISLPQPEVGGPVRVYFPKVLEQSAKRKGISKQLERFRPAEIEMKEIRNSPEEFLMVFRASMLDDFDGDFPTGTTCLYSRWHGYLTNADWKVTTERLVEAQGTLHEVHTSGHMHSADIVRFVNQINPRMIVPIHTFEPERFGSHFGNVALLTDGVPHIVA